MLSSDACFGFCFAVTVLQHKLWLRRCVESCQGSVVQLFPHGELLCQRAGGGCLGERCRDADGPSPLLFHGGRTFITQSLCTNQSSVVKLLMAGFIIYLQKGTFILLPLRCVCCFLQKIHFLSPQGTAVGQEHLHMGRVVVEKNVCQSMLWSSGKP